MGGCGECLAKFGLISFNIIFMLTGIAVLGVGIWVKVDKTAVNIQNVIKVDTNDAALNTAAWVLIGFGAFVLIVSAFGFFAACKQSKFFIAGYIVFLVIIFCGEFAGGITAAVFKGKIDDELPGILRRTFDKYKPGDNLLAKAWDYLQTLLSCCGADGPFNYKKAKDNFNYTAQWYVPKTCCVLTNSNPESPQPKNLTLCQREAAGDNIISNATKQFKYLNEKGCYASMNDKIHSHLALVIGVGVGIGMFQLLGIVLAICVCRRDDSDNKPY